MTRIGRDVLIWTTFLEVEKKVAVHGVSFLADPPATCGTV
jgi:hypothetical protein